MSNKVKFGLKNCHYAPYTIGVDGVPLYEEPIHVPGSVELTMEPRGDMTEFYADDMLFYSAGNNQGYDGTLSIALIPESFAVDCLGDEKDDENGLLHEIANAKTKPFALLFEFDGDVKATRHVFYNCTANRPTVSSSTKTNTVEPTPDELTFIASPIGLLADSPNVYVKSKSLSSMTAAKYNQFFAAVPVPTLVPEGV